jgi:predicted O-linked N-acetylglucosamine transferase (SPINDLY family)
MQAAQSAKSVLIAGMKARDRGDLAGAEALFRRALAADPAYARAHANLGELLSNQGRTEDAEQHLRRAIDLDADDVRAWNNLGNLLARFPARKADAEAAFQNALRIEPDNVAALHNYATLLKSGGNAAGAKALWQRAVAAHPGHLKSLLALHYGNRQECDWSSHSEYEGKILELIRAGTAAPFTPFILLSTASTAKDQFEAAWRYAATLAVPQARQLHPRQPRPDERIRIGYLSRDFYQHATSALIAEVLEKHDRKRFELWALDYSPEDRSPMRWRVLAAFDRVFSLKGMSDEIAARAIHAEEIDILVDLKGYTKSTRSRILAHRPAPSQVNFLGYPGTMGGDFVDYILGDPVVTSFADQPFFSERIVQLPDCYQPNDRNREVAAPPTRADYGLPEGAFVFCCFNNTYKISPDTFAVWMRLLQAMPFSVLWLFEAKRNVASNLRMEAAAQSVDPDRLIFAPAKPMAEHIARYPLADLFLDTLPYNAHTTASEAIWAGLPILTLAGSTFAGRVCASILRAAGLPELITHSLAEYEQRALTLARERTELAAIRAKIETTRQSMPLFDTDRFTAGLEDAYQQMWRLWAEGRPPEQISASSAKATVETRGASTKGAGPVQRHAKPRGAPPSLRDLLNPDRLTAVVDVGANPIGGEPRYKKLLLAGLCTVVGFEPQSQARAALDAQKGPFETYLPYAVADGRRHLLRICAASGMTSLLEPDPEALALFNQFPNFGRVTSEVEIETRRTAWPKPTATGRHHRGRAPGARRPG